MTNWIDLNGASLRYHHRPGSGRTMVLLHEMGGSLESWDDVLTHLPDDVAVLRYDMRGAGLSEKLVVPCTFDTHVDDLQALLDECRVEGPFLLAGIAVGAAVALHYALRHPQRVAQLVAMAPAWGVPAAAREDAVRRGSDIAWYGMRGDALALLERAYPAALRTDPDRYERYRCRWLSNDARSLGAVYQMLAGLDQNPDLRGLPARTVLVAGTLDPLRPPAEIDRLAALAPQAEALHVVSGHFMATQSPVWVATLLQRYGSDPASSASALYQAFMAQPGHRLGEIAHAA